MPVQYLYQGLYFNSPFLLTYIGTSLFVILIPSRLLWERRYRIYARLKCFSSDNLNAPNEVIIPWSTNVVERSRKMLRDFGNWCYDDSDMMTEKDSLHRGSGSLSPMRSRVTASDSFDRPLSPQRSGSPSFQPKAQCQVPEHYILSHTEHIGMALRIAPLWFVSNYFYNLSLAYTTITSSTVLSSTGSVFTFIFSLTCGDERFSKWKVLGVLMAFLGSLLTALHDASNSNEDDGDLYKHQIWGDVAGLISAVGYGGYTVLVRVLCPADEDRMSMQLFLGYVGAINMVLLSPFLLWVFDGMNGVQVQNGDQTEDQSQGMGEEEYYGAQQLTMFVFLCLVAKGLLDNVLSDYLWARSIILTSATVATVGLGLTIPLALLSDVFIMQRGDVLDTSSVIGAILVLVGFVSVNIGEGNDDIELSISEDNNELVTHSTLV